MAKRVLSFSGSSVIDVIADPFDFASKENEAERMFYPAKKLDELQSLCGPLSSDEEIETAFLLHEEAERQRLEDIEAQKG